MFPSWRIGRPFGINLFIHWTFWLLPLWIVLSAPAAGAAAESNIFPLGLQLALVGALFTCVVLHELGHALSARGFGIETHSIVLTPIGGVARFEQPIRTPWQEFCIALAGPLVNLVIAAVLGGLYFAATSVQPAWRGTRGGDIIFVLLLLNLVMAVFNLLPAFPMDGGRVLRALLTPPLGRLAATRIAVTVGSIVILLVALGWAVYVGSLWTLAIAAFVLWTGQRELADLETQERQRTAYQDEITPTVMPVRSTVAWPGPSAPVTVYVWDAQQRRWVREASPGT
jgi:Zn-dependent protease